MLELTEMYTSHHVIIIICCCWYNGYPLCVVLVWAEEQGEEGPVCSTSTTHSEVMQIFPGPSSLLLGELLKRRATIMHQWVLLREYQINKLSKVSGCNSSLFCYDDNHMMACVHLQREWVSGLQQFIVLLVQANYSVWPLTNCNSNIFNCFLHRNMPSITY